MYHCFGDHDEINKIVYLCWFKNTKIKTKSDDDECRLRIYGFHIDIFVTHSDLTNIIFKLKPNKRIKINELIFERIESTFNLICSLEIKSI